MHILLMILVVLAGSAIALQSGMSGQLGKLLNQPLYGSLVVYATSFMFTLLFLLIPGRGRLPWPGENAVAAVPLHLWFAGGFLSAVGLGCVYWMLPRLGAARVIALVLIGQVITGMIAGHFGWFGLPENRITLARFSGSLMMAAGVILINR